MMAAKPASKLYGSALNFSANQRRVSRFTLRDQHLWSVRLNGRALPIESVQDISWAGACLRTKDAAAAPPSKEVLLEVFYRRQLLFDVRGRVCWVREVSSYLGLFHTGIEFTEQGDRIEKLWQKKELDTMVREPSARPGGAQSKRQFDAQITGLLIKFSQALLLVGAIMSFYFILR